MTQTQPQSDDTEDSMRLRVVFLDDQPMMRRAFVQAAALRDIEVSTAATEEEAWAALATKRADVAVLDFSLADDGTSAQLVRELAEGGHLVLIWTGNPGAARDAVGEGVPIVGKSSNIDVLFSALAQLVRARVLELATTIEEE